MNARTAPGREAQPDPAQRPTTSQRLERAEAPGENRYTSMIPSGTSDVGRGQRQVLAPTLTKITLPMNWVVETRPGTM